MTGRVDFGIIHSSIYLMSNHLLIVVWGATLCMTGRVQASLVAEDNFNYSNGSSLAGANGGTGWTGAWINDYTSGTSLQASSTGLTYPGLTTGGSAVWVSGGNGISEDSRSLALQSAGLVYIQFLCQFGSASGGGTPNIRLYNSGTLTGGFGANGGTYGSVLSILDGSLTPAANGSSSSTASLSGVNLVVGLIDYQNDSTKLWVNPDLATFDYATPPAPDASYAGLAPAFNQIAIYSRSPATVSDLQITTVPEPVSAAMAGFGLVVLGFGLGRRWWAGFRR